MKKLVFLCNFLMILVDRISTHQTHNRIDCLLLKTYIFHAHYTPWKSFCWQTSHQCFQMKFLCLHKLQYLYTRFQILPRIMQQIDEQKRTLSSKLLKGHQSQSHQHWLCFHQKRRALRRLTRFFQSRAGFLRLLGYILSSFQSHIWAQMTVLSGHS